MTTFEALSKHKVKTTLSTDYAKQHNMGHMVILDYIKLLIKYKDDNSKYFISQKYGPEDDLKARYIILPKGIEHLNEHYNLNNNKMFNSKDIF